MAKLRHLALSVRDLEKTASFYEKSFGLQRLKQNHEAITLADGVISVTLLKLAPGSIAVDERGTDFIGVHHFGFMVDDPAEARQLIEANGGTHVSDSQNVMPGMTAETKYKDPNGIVFDVVHAPHAWKGAS